MSKQALVEGGVWLPNMVCHVISLDYNFAQRLGRLFMIDGVCCDMEGCIATFMKIDRKVELIFTFSGKQQDTVYRKVKRGQWEVFMPRIV